MRNIVLTRVDDRLIHGEVVMGWVPAMRITRIIIVDDSMAGNPFAVRALQALVPPNMKCYVYTTEKAVDRLMADGPRGERLLLLVKTPLTLQALAEKGLVFEECNLGCAGIDAGRKPFFKNISLSRQEVQALDVLRKKGCEPYYQLVPDQKRYDVSSAIEEALREA
ncbi:MAG: PTS sugar transporter subunit IIB [Sarcina sp.]|nr:PTS sugar transporter subunit IIB [Sarcina sp.]